VADRIGLVEEDDEYERVLRCGTGSEDPSNNTAFVAQLIDLCKALGPAACDDSAPSSSSSSSSASAQNTTPPPHEWPLSAYELLAACLHPDPARRITASQALLHPFFFDPCVVSASASSPTSTSSSSSAASAASSSSALSTLMEELRIPALSRPISFSPLHAACYYPPANSASNSPAAASPAASASAPATAAANTAGAAVVVVKNPAVK
jgi:serine/threonine protein kinase